MSEIKGIPMELTDKVLNGEVVDLFENKRQKLKDILIDEQIDDDDELDQILTRVRRWGCICRDYKYNPKISRNITRTFDNGVIVEYDTKIKKYKVYNNSYINPEIYKDFDDDDKGIYHYPNGENDFIICCDKEEADEYNDKLDKMIEKYSLEEGEEPYIYLMELEPYLLFDDEDLL